MSAKTARTHTHLSNRAKAHRDAERKTVYKSVLDNPFKISWPSVPVNVQNQFLAMMVNLTNGLAEYRMGRKRKRPRREEHAGGRATPKKRKGDITSDPIDTDIPESLPGALTVPPLSGAPNTNDTADFGSSVPVPSILRHLTTGINEVTRKLEAQIQSSRQTVVVSDKDVISSEAMSQPRIKVVFVCRADIDPPILIDHIPHLITACNSSARFTDLVKLVPLPKGAEFTLAEAMGLRRVAVVAVDNAAQELSIFSSLLESVPTLTAPWLLSSIQATTTKPPDLVSTHIKQIRTSAPKDMKAAKDQRAKGRAAAKLKHKVRREPKSVKLSAAPSQPLHAPHTSNVA